MLSTGQFPSPYVPTIQDFDRIRVETKLGTYNIDLWDTAGAADYDRIRVLAYYQAAVVVVCYSIDSLESFANVTERWIPQVREFAGGARIIVVGCKRDLRNTFAENVFVPTAEGKRIAAVHRAASFVECSGLSGESVDDVRSSIIQACVPRVEESKCVIA